MTVTIEKTAGSDCMIPGRVATKRSANSQTLQTTHFFTIIIIRRVEEKKRGHIKMDAFAMCLAREAMQFEEGLIIRTVLNQAANLSCKAEHHSFGDLKIHILM